MQSTIWSNITELNLTSTVASVVSKNATPPPEQQVASAAEFELILPFIFGILVILSLSLVVFYYKPPEQSYHESTKQEQTATEKEANVYATRDWEMSAIFGTYK